MNNLSDKEKQAVDALARDLCKEPAMMIEPVHQNPAEDRKKLGLYNAAIDALKALMDSNALDDCSANMNTGHLLEQLTHVRMATFEYMVPWDMIATGKVGVDDGTR